MAFSLVSVGLARESYAIEDDEVVSPGTPAASDEVGAPPASNNAPAAPPSADEVVSPPPATAAPVPPAPPASDEVIPLPPAAVAPSAPAAPAVPAPPVSDEVITLPPAVAAPPAESAVAASPTAPAKAGGMKAVPVSGKAGGNISGLEVTTEALEMSTATINDEARQVVVIRGTFLKSLGWTLQLDKKKVELQSAGPGKPRPFSVQVPLEGNATRIEFVAIGPRGNRERKRYEIIGDLTAPPPAQEVAGVKQSFFEKRIFARVSLGGFTDVVFNGTTSTNLLVAFPGVGGELRYWRGEREDSGAWQFQLGGYVSRTEDIGTMAFPWVYGVEAQVGRRALLGSANSVVVSPWLGIADEAFTQAGAFPDATVGLLRESVAWAEAGFSFILGPTAHGLVFEATPAFLKSLAASVSTGETISGWGGQLGLRVSTGGHFFAQAQARYLKFSGDRDLKGNTLDLGAGWRF